MYKTKQKASFVQVLAQSVQKKQGVCHIVTLPIYIKKVVKSQGNLGAIFET